MPDSPDKSTQQSGMRRKLSRYVIALTAVAVVVLVPLRMLSDEPDVDAQRSFRYLVQICKIGRRFSGSQGMATQQNVIAQHFAKFGAQIRYQAFDAPHPQTGMPVRMMNIIVSWHPESKERVLFACHYDTRPFPDRDRFNPRGVFVGANDGASGVALFMEMAHHMRDLDPKYGVDFVFFDGEELVYSKNDKYFLGSEYFAKQYRDKPPAHRYIYGVLVDMIADRRLNLFFEKNSMKYAPQLTRSIWNTARDLRIREFTRKTKHEINDDHIPLNQIAKIPTCDLIDFDYRYWHTTKDVPSACSGSSIKKVARVLLRWLENIPSPS